jgi:hypothetical protein
MNVTINQLERTTADDVVTIAHWSASVVDGDYSASAYGTQSFTRDADSPELVPFEDLTEETVVGWVLNSFPKVTVVTQEAVEATYDDDGNVVTEAVEEVREETDQYQMEVNLLAKIEEQKAPQMVTGKPWDVVLEEVA